MCRLLTLLALIPLIAWPSAAVAADTLDEIALVVGQTRTLAISRSVDANVVRGDPTVIDITPIPNEGQIAITGLKPGISSLVLFEHARRRNYVVRVYGMPPETVMREVRQLIEGIPGVDVRTIGNRVVLDGRIYTAAERDRLQRIVAMYPGSIESLFHYDEAGATRRPMFALQLQVVDLRDVDSLDLGPEWPTSIVLSGEGALGYDSAAADGPKEFYRGVVSTQDVKVGLHLLTSEGYAEIRSTSTLVTEEGNAATYEVGGEFFVRTSSLSGGGVERIRYGTKLAIRPSIDEQRQVRLLIDAHVSQPDDSQSVDRIPGLLTNAVQTRVNLREGETIVLSGLDDRREGSSENGLWPFAEIPIIGYLFKRHQSSEATRRTLILVTPRLYLPGDDFHRRQIEPILQRVPDDADADF